jgi:hypothetical protein
MRGFVQEVMGQKRGDKFIEDIGDPYTAAALALRAAGDKTYNSALDVLLATGLGPGIVDTGGDLVTVMKTLNAPTDFESIEGLDQTTRDGYLIAGRMGGFSSRMASYLNALDQAIVNSAGLRGPGEGLEGPPSLQGPVFPPGGINPVKIAPNKTLNGQPPAVQADGLACNHDTDPRT